MSEHCRDRRKIGSEESWRITQLGKEVRVDCISSDERYLCCSLDFIKTLIMLLGVSESQRISI